MKIGLMLKTTVSIVAISIITQIPVINKNISYENCLYKNFNIVSNAINSIKSIKDNNKPYKIFQKYNVNNNNTVTITTKIHYSSYRKKPETNKKTLHTNTSPINAKTLCFVYNSKKDKNHIIQTIEGSKENTKIALNKNTKLVKSA